MNTPFDTRGLRPEARGRPVLWRFTGTGRGAGGPRRSAAGPEEQEWGGGQVGLSRGLARPGNRPCSWQGCLGRRGLLPRVLMPS